MARCPTVKAAIRIAAIATIGTSTEVTLRWLVRPSAAMTPSASQPIRSLTMPTAMVTWPKLRRMKPSSSRIFAITGSDEIDSATAMKRTNAVEVPWPPRKSCGITRPVPRPTTNGSASPPMATAVAGRPSLRTIFRSVSKPVRTSRNATPPQPIALIGAAPSLSCGTNTCAAPGHSLASTDGPSSTPASSSPTTGGCPIRRIAAPSVLATATTTKSCTHIISRACSSSDGRRMSSAIYPPGHAEKTGQIRWLDGTQRVCPARVPGTGPAMPASSTLVAGRYRLGAELGSGGMGVVWEAYDELLHRTVAVKEIRYPIGISDEDREKLARRTLREARAVAAVEDPHAVRVFDIVEQDGRPWLVMELVRGRTLTEMLREDGPLPAPEVARIGMALLDALQTAHAAGVLHRDVKPSNVIVGHDGRVALTDFGIATVDSDPTGVTTSSQLVGSPAYMAPERARGEQPTPASDLWSLGATLWTAAEGQPPYDEGSAFATMTKVVSEDPPACLRCEGPLGSVLRALMARDPEARPTIAETRQRLTTAAHETTAPVTAYPTEPLRPSFDRTVALERAVATPAVAPVRSRRPLALLALALLLVAGVVAVVIAATHTSASRSPAASPPRPTHSAAAKSSSQPSSGASAAGLPSGWHRYTDSAVGWSIGVPPGWQAQPSGSEVFLRDPAGGRYLQIDTKNPAGPSAKGAWEDQERAFRASHPGYQRISLDNVDWRDYPDVADWEFTYTDGGAQLHAVDRGAVVSGRGYGLFFQTHDDQWDASQDLRQSFYDSFQPAG